VRWHVERVMFERVKTRCDTTLHVLQFQSISSVGKTSRRSARAGNEWDGLGVGKRARMPGYKYKYIYHRNECMSVG
jgi:hypothetical protein